jgi:leader peptidase (prepilin peptidase)/N-methyltransferase
MMMAGAFVGWQPVLTAFLLSVIPALVLAIIQIVRRGDQRLPFGPPLGGGVLLAVFFWPILGGHFWGLYSEPLFLLLLLGGGAILLLVMGLLLRLTRGVPADASGLG